MNLSISTTIPRRVTGLLLLAGLAFSPPTRLAAQTNAPARSEPTNAAEAALQKKYGDKLKPQDYAAYQKLVAALPPDEQAWEKVLEDQLGGFYFPIHVRDRLTHHETAWTFVKDDPALPRVLLIGDSISRSYTVGVRHQLAGQANVHRAPANCGPTDSGLKNMDAWLGSGKWDVIHFNFGIHDRAKKPELYAANLEQVIARLEKTGAQLVWARTTPFKGKGSKVEDDSPALNKVSDELMQQHGIPVDDLHAAVSGVVATARNADDTHFNEAGVRLLAAQVVKSIEPLLSTNRYDAYLARATERKIDWKELQHEKELAERFTVETNRHEKLIAGIATLAIFEVPPIKDPLNRPYGIDFTTKPWKVSEETIRKIYGEPGRAHKPGVLKHLWYDFGGLGNMGEWDWSMIVTSYKGFIVDIDFIGVH